MGREGFSQGDGKVRDKGLEIRIGHPHACHVFSRVVR